ncbi:hypothetical protein [Amycolatopsis japonica]|uniref:hypothetical protein n=1 Tax=Amycolatopsis japonica TaxID=208439 RepID=UPI0033EAC8E8
MANSLSLSYVLHGSFRGPGSMFGMSPAPDGPWYASSTFWAIAGVAVAIVFGIGAIVAAYRSQNPRRRLYVYVASATPLMHEKGRDLAIEVSIAGRAVEDPYLVTVHVVVRGRRDIRKDDFDGPIRLRFGSRIVGLLERTSTTVVPATPAPEVTHQPDSDLLEVAPALLRRDHELTYTLLLEGGEPALDPEVPIVADIRETEPGMQQMWGALSPLACFAFITLSFTSAITYFDMDGSGMNRYITLGATIVGLAGTVVTFVVMPKQGYGE